ncbi:hypothetical protein HYE67_008353 [Fusarium culmorum]|uniref:Uncharacterized protein n=2 Tax=Fusarium sambucinum species complex TaxID=569360 RepID=A0A2T4HAJ1_FUSCU|nr:hypothetical protein FPSE_00082 [Fusarium pseudograminearum CS3096]EKJ79802.1 hypothetical protein FPSE_00082 [Fusarium pseudograminearum CS3096]KAF0638046.1 hypothetical protein FPSE5266_00082 [Fusarium pseudograminearum]PTD12823.1 hypothetical protein FCULG_00003043 [Fusarium culmorum]QPC66122.1 hypothetical protein HYE67_008353 [Fusarium culmorum]
MPSVDSPSMATHFITSFLPPELAETVQKHILSPRSPVQVVVRNVLVQAQNVIDTVTPIVEPILDRVMILLAENQGLVGVIASLLVLATVVIILNWIRRLLMWWTRMAMRIMTWAFMFALAAWIWERGVFESARDMTVIGARILGYLAVIKDVWLQEYDRYEAQQGMAGTRGPASGRSR